MPAETSPCPDKSRPDAVGSATSGLSRRYLSMSYVLIGLVDFAAVALAVGYVMNIYHIVMYTGGHYWWRLVGVWLPPLGAIMGWLW